MIFGLAPKVILMFSFSFTRYPPNPTVDYSGNNSTLLLETHAAKVSNAREPVPTLADTPVEERSSDFKSLVTVPAMAVEAPTVVPVCLKSNQFEVGHRRMRRPFSVDEVEALVHAVETLGPGRYVVDTFTMS